MLIILSITVVAALQLFLLSRITRILGDLRRLLDDLTAHGKE